MTELERFAWKYFLAVVQKFLGNYKADDRTELLNEMLISFKTFGCNMSIKVDYHRSHLDYSQHNL